MNDVRSRRASRQASQPWAHTTLGGALATLSCDLGHLIEPSSSPGRWLATRNRRFGSLRAKVKHIFRVMKFQLGYRKVRYRGIAQKTAHRRSRAVEREKLQRMYLEIPRQAHLREGDERLRQM